MVSFCAWKFRFSGNVGGNSLSEVGEVVLIFQIQIVLKFLGNICAVSNKNLMMVHFDRRKTEEGKVTAS